jgi:hypothetical protein
MACRGARRSILVVFPVAVLGGCAIHPVQQDVTGLPTTQIVRRIRCEARLAIIDKAIGMLGREAEKLADEPALSFYGLTREQQLRKLQSIAEKLNAGRTQTIEHIGVSELPTPRSRAFYIRYIDTVIAYDFLFNITEGGTAAAVADPVRLISNGSVGFGLNAGGTLRRNNLRNFALSDQFDDLLFDKKLQCRYPDYLPDNYVHPIAGAVGLRGAIDTFIDLYQGGPLSKLDEKEPGVFADTLQFTTEISGGVGSHVQIDPIGINWGVAAPTNIGLSASRSDIHTLTIGLAMSEPAKPTKKTSRGLVERSIDFREMPPPPTARATNNDNARGAIRALRYRNFLERAGTLR